MFKARKLNKEYSIDAKDKNKYLKAGYDVYSEDGTVEYAENKTVSYEEYIELKNKLETLNTGVDIETLESENESLKGTIETLESEKTTLTEKVEKLEKEIETLKKKNKEEK